jgi:type I restriction enzyme S subunit
MSSEWIETTLGKICKFQGGAIQTGPFGSQLHTSDYKKFGIPVVMPTNINDGGIFEDGIARIESADVERLSQHKLHLGDIIFSRRGDVTKNALIRSREIGWLCGTGCLKVRLGNESMATAKFISHCLRHPDTKDWLIRHAVGATMPNLNTGILSNVPVNLPPLQTQQEIALILDTLDDRITLLRETNATLEAIAQALFKSWFVDFDPVHAKAQGRQPEGMDEQTAALFPDRFVESELGMVPLGWEVGELADMSKNNSTPFDFSKVEKVVFVNTGDVFNGEFLHQNYSLKEGLPGQAKKAIYENDILFSEIRPKNGRFAYVNFDAKDYVVSTKFMVLRAINNFPPRYLYQVLRQTETIEYFHVIAESRSGTFPQITFDSVKNYRLIKPSSVCLEKYIECVNPIFHKIDLLNKQAQTLSNLRDTLLPRLISGQLRLPDVDA